MGALAGCDARRRPRRMAIPCKRPATPQRARQYGQNVQVIVYRLLKGGGAGIDEHGTRGKSRGAATIKNHVQGAHTMRQNLTVNDTLPGDAIRTVIPATTV